jgi:hypothetical protein
METIVKFYCLKMLKIARARAAMLKIVYNSFHFFGGG